MDLYFIGNRIKQLRINANITMAQLATTIESSSGYISDLEKAKRIPSIELLLKICMAFNITLSQFFNESTEPIALTPQLKEFINQNKDLTPEQLEALSAFIKTLK